MKKQDKGFSQKWILELYFVRVLHFLDFCYFIWEDTVIFNIKYYCFLAYYVFIDFILIIRCSTWGTIICEKYRSKEGGNGQMWAALNHCTVLTMDIELAVIFSLVVHIVCFTEGIFWMAHLNLSNWTNFGKSYKKWSVDLLFSA